MFGLEVQRADLAPAQRGGFQIGRATIEKVEIVECDGSDLYTTYEHPPYTVVSILLGRRLWYIQRARD